MNDTTKLFVQSKLIRATAGAAHRRNTNCVSVQCFTQLNEVEQTSVSSACGLMLLDYW